ncbi:MAG: Protein of unknown function, rane YfhO [Frankiales bacterium]|nr:Protein of unknown function, rane YfhO [Frankiales bacterium]
MAGLCAVLVVLAIGPSLVGIRVFAGSDLALAYAPWRATQPAQAQPDNSCVSDTVDGFIPAAAEFRRELGKGHVAQWNPLASGGAPLAAVPSNAVWSPLSLPFIVLPTWLAPAWVKLLEIVVSIGGMFLFLRRLNLARAPALLGGLVYTTSGFMISWTNWPHTRVAAFVPLLLWSLERLVQLRTAKAAVPIALTLAAMLLGGFPAVVGYALYLGGPYFLMRLIATRDTARTFISTGLLAGVGLAVGGMLAAFQLLPFFAQLSGLDLDIRHQLPVQHLPLLSLVTVALPKAFGTCAGQDYIGPIGEVEANAYVGSAVLVLAILSLLRRRRSETPAGPRTFFLLAALVCVVLGWLGGPLLAAAQHLPVFSNNPVGRIRVILGFCIAVLAAMGYDALLRSREEKPRRWTVAVWLALGAASLLVLRRVRNNLRPTHHLAQSDRQTLYAALAVAVVLAAIALARSRWHRLAVAAVPVVVLAQALNVVLSYWPQVPRHDFYPSTPVHRFLAEHLGHDRFQGMDLAMMPGTNVYYGLRSLGGHAFTATTWRQLMETADPVAFRTPTFSTIEANPTMAVSPALDRFSVRYLVVPPEKQAFGAVQEPPQPAGTTELGAGGSLELPFAGGGLRGISLTLAQPAGTADGNLMVDVLQGDRLISGAGRRIFPSTGPGELDVALAAEDLTAGPAVLRIRNTMRQPVVLTTGRDGRPLVGLVRPAADGLEVAQATPSGTVYERTRALPRIRWASTVDKESLKAAGSTAAQPGHVLLASNPDGARGASGAVSVVHDGPDEVSTDVVASGAGYLVVADGFQSSWRATVDGKPAALLPADHALVAVAVPAGKHRVQLTYHPGGVGRGTVLSVLGLLALLGLALSSRLRRRTAEPA